MKAVVIFMVILVATLAFARGEDKDKDPKGKEGHHELLKDNKDKDKDHKEVHPPLIKDNKDKEIKDKLDKENKDKLDKENKDKLDKENKDKLDKDKDKDKKGKINRDGKYIVAVTKTVPIVATVESGYTVPVIRYLHHHHRPYYYYL